MQTGVEHCLDCTKAGLAIAPVLKKSVRIIFGASCLFMLRQDAAVFDAAMNAPGGDDAGGNY